LKKDSWNRLQRTASLLAWGLVCASPLAAVEPIRLNGTLAGRVLDAAGIPQMGAVVQLFNKFDRGVGKAITNDRGSFTFDTLIPDTYSLRVSLASFVPAVKRNISIQPGMRSFLAINLTSVLSSIELVYITPGQGAVMSDDWKWVLRSAGATRPVLRYIPGVDISDPSRRSRSSTNVFSETRGLFRVSNGDMGALSSLGNQADLGTAFALATSLFGVNQVSVSGNLGYASHSGIPTAGFRTSFSREIAGGWTPEVNVTMRQIFLPARIGTTLSTGRSDNIPALQTLAITFVERRQLADELELEYGSSLESVSFVDRLNYFSPFARLRWGTAEGGAIELAYSSGTPATELLHPGEILDAELNHQLTTLSLFPRVSLRDGRAHVQRNQNLEIGYRREISGRIVSASAYRESFSNTALNAAAPAGLFPPSELMPDLNSNNYIFNAGGFRRMGYHAAFTEQIGEKLNATVAWGWAGALAAPAVPLASSNPGELRSMLRRAGRHSFTARLTGTAPGMGTKYTASYQVTDYNVLQPVHLSLTQRATLEPGFNFYLRQPIPRMGSVIPGRLEASAELRNMLAQGYLPIATPGGHKLLLIQSPRSVRGGLSFIF